MPRSKFRAKSGQVDYTNIRYCPVINCVLKYQDKILLVQRSQEMNFYPGYWNGVSGFLDDSLSIEDKVIEELDSELSLSKDQIKSITKGRLLVQEAPKYQKTWIVFPVLVEVSTDNVKLDWEASKFSWLTLNEARKLDLLPGFREVLDELLVN